MKPIKSLIKTNIKVDPLILLAFFPLTILIAIIFVRIRIEFLWFESIGYIFSLVTRLVWQLGSLFSGAIITLLLYKWQSKWIKIKAKDEISSKRKSLNGWSYSLSIITCSSIIVLLLRSEEHRVG